jgi:hypothetical protein
MDSLGELVGRIEPGDCLAWQAAGGKSKERVKSRTVTAVEYRPDSVLVEAAGPDGGTYHFVVDESGESEVFFHTSNGDPTSLGRLVFAELTPSEEFVSVKRGWYDSR